MKREQAEKLATEYLNPLYGFVLKRCAHLQDAEDLTQEIVLKVFRTHLRREDIEAPDKFIWTTSSDYCQQKTIPQTISLKKKLPIVCTEK